MSELIDWLDELIHDPTIWYTAGLIAFVAVCGALSNFIPTRSENK